VKQIYGNNTQPTKVKNKTEIQKSKGNTGRSATQTTEREQTEVKSGDPRGFAFPAPHVAPVIWPPVIN